jgi:XTP/dITP diphosphohydrolase
MNHTIPTPQNPTNPLSQMEAFIEIVRILRKECPWDSEQTPKSISHLMIEEVYEVYDAIEKQDIADIPQELGDVLLHIVMQCVMGEEKKLFSLTDVIKSISEKMIRRHPHIFGEVNAEDTKQVLQNWEKIKMTEGRKSVFDGVPKALPSLLKAERIQEKAAKVGFDWSDKVDVWKKVEEEIAELKVEINQGDKERIEDELGDVIFALVNAARFERIVPENALQGTNAKFIRRFQYIEKMADKSGLSLNEMSLKDMDAIWNEAKQNEK